ncbi:MAG: CvfB family protein [Pseudobdellovibrionaceae bacterium]
MENQQVQIGQTQMLRILEIIDRGAYLDGGADGQILLPIRYLPETAEVGQDLDVFIYLDSDDRLIATTEKPYARLGEFALLQVVAVESVGAFLDWGLPKDLFLPFAEQTKSLREGQDVLVFPYLDNSGRLAASMRLERNMSKEPATYKESEAVQLIIAFKTDLGFKAIINGKHWGVLYSNEVFQPLHYGQEVSGFIKKIREDGKIDLGLQRTGHQAGEDIAPKILEMLKEKGGFLEINDKTSAQIIYDLFGVSKKKYKIALGGLYKKRLIKVEDDGIRLV